MYSSFSQTHKDDNVGIVVNFVFPYICSFLLYLHQLMLVNVKLEITGRMRITFLRINASFDQLIFNVRDKTKLAMLAFLCCRDIVKNSICFLMR